MERREIETLTKAIETFGTAIQIDIAIEECSELINALCKWKRRRVGDSEVVTEIADVQIMMAQMALMFGWDEVDEERQKKLARLERRIAENNINKK